MILVELCHLLKEYVGMAMGLRGEEMAQVFTLPSKATQLISGRTWF